MAVLQWDAAGSRYFENGVDRVVLFPPNGDGVAWSGVTAIKESNIGAALTPVYLDGRKIAQVIGNSDFGLSIEAYGAPTEFGVCDGSKSVGKGLYTNQQPRQLFDLSYRTRVGSDTDARLGYKIHLVYGCLAAPTGRDFATNSDSPDATKFTWSITTQPPIADFSILGSRPSAEFVIDTRVADPADIVQLEKWIYGTEVDASVMPTIAQLSSLFA